MCRSISIKLKHRENIRSHGKKFPETQAARILSAFVILSSLLYYMRRDDTDIFADKNEGKVLIMDNPFAQTNASHLLIPLMDMAKRPTRSLSA